jgi:hypothetical protein
LKSNEELIKLFASEMSQSGKIKGILAQRAVNSVVEIILNDWAQLGRPGLFPVDGDYLHILDKLLCDVSISSEE